MPTKKKKKQSKDLKGKRPQDSSDETMTLVPVPVEHGSLEPVIPTRNKSLVQAGLVGTDSILASTEVIKNLAKLGIEVESQGTLNVAQGMTVLTANTVIKAMGQLDAYASKSERNAIRVARQIGYLAGQVGKLSNQIQKGAPVVTTAQQEARPKLPSFPAGQPVIIQGNVINHYGEKKTEPAPEKVIIDTGTSEG